MTITLKDYFNRTCNYCNQYFEHEPIFHDSHEVFAFCSQECLDKLNRFCGLMSCGHHPSSIVSNNEGTRYCKECEDVSNNQS